MASPDLDRNHFSIDHLDRSAEEEVEPQSQMRPDFRSPHESQSLDDTALYLPATTYTNPVRSHRSKLSISTDLNNRPVIPRYGQLDGPAVDGEASPDPHEYYRQLHDPFAARTVGQANQNEVPKSARGNNVSKRKSSLSSVWPGVASEQGVSRVDIRQPYQASPPSQYREGPPASARSNSSLVSQSRPRQASFQDLVAKFDRRGGSQSAHQKAVIDNDSGNVSPATSFGISDGGSRNVSLSKIRGLQKKPAARKPSQESAGSSKASASNGVHPGSANRLHSFELASNRKASQSLTNLDPSNSRNPRRPLFGEIIASTSAKGAFSHGVHHPNPRRGSVDSPMHSPNPMFPRAVFNLESNLSATSPDAWYRGFSPFPNVVDDGSHNDAKPSQHRRAQSDISTTPWRSQILLSQPQNLMHMGPATEISSGEPSADSVRAAPSRIPVRRRHSHASDAATSAPSSRAPSVLAEYQTNQEDLSMGRKVPSRSVESPVSPRRTTISPLPTISATKSPSRRDRSRTAQQGQKSPLLRANIIAPPPKISPPLRSSRPRLPVSAASTTSSRAKTMERLSSLQKQGQDALVSVPRSRRPPELDNIDLEARRRQITQAFNKTIRENAQKEKLAADRRRKARERAQAEELARRNDSTRTIRQSDLTARAATTHREAAEKEESDGDVFKTPREEFTASERDLRAAPPTISDPHVAVSTVQARESVEEDDSPTLGRPHEFRSRTMSRCQSASDENDLPPSSAVTADTDGTTFDNEAQIESADSRTVLSQIMDMRESSTAASPALSENGSEQADKESVQIILRNTAYYDHSDSPGQQDLNTELESRPTFLNDNDNDEKLEQSSTSSWTSSMHDPSSLEGPLESIAEKSPDHRGQPTDRQSPASVRSNKDSSTGTQSAAVADAYDSVSRVLEKDQRIAAVNRNHFGDIYQKILEQSPDLARQGGWDTQRVTQLCLQEIDRSKYERLSRVSSPEKKTRENKEVTRTMAASPGPKVRSPEKSVQGHKYRASLNNAEDFAFTSPSIVDWMQFAAADSPTDEGEDIAPPLPPKDSESSVRRDGISTPRAGHANESSSLGLNIHLKSPSKSSLSRTPPPRPPSHSPPPVPHVSRSINEATTTVLRSPSTYEHGPSSSIVVTHKSKPAQPPQVPRRITSLSMMASPSNSTEALLVSAKDSGSAASSSFLGGRPSLEQSGVDSNRHTASLSPEQRRLIRRKHVIKELVDTEASFGRDMSVVDDIYKGTSTSCLDLSSDDIKTLFGNSAQIVKFSMDFLDSLKLGAKSIYTMPKSQRFQSKRMSRAASGSTFATSASDDQAAGESVDVTDLEKDRGTFVGEAFKNNLAEMEKVYTVYLKNHDAANRKLQALQQNPKVEIWLNECRQWASDLTNAWDLDSLLVKPVQRLLKYPLLLTQLLESTPEEHPDRSAIRDATHDLTEISIRINDMKKHSELVEQGLKRNRKESDVRIGLSKAIGRQTEKLKQNVGVSRVVEDREYAALRDRYSENLAHLVLVREDVKMYLNAISKNTHHFHEFSLAIDGWIDVGHTGFPEKESRWRQFGMIVRELVTVAVPEHLGAIQKVVIDPMTNAAKMLEALMKDPKGLIQKRDKKSIDYARWKNVKDRGEKLDKKAIDRMEEWEALNREAKGRMTKLTDLTSHLAQGCLKSFVQIQCTWLMIWQRKLTVVIGATVTDISKITREWQEDFDHHEAQALVLGVCNGSLLADAVNLFTLGTPASTFDGAYSPRHPSWIGAGKRSFSINSDNSPKPSNEFASRHSGSFTASPMAESYERSHHIIPANRMRAVSTASGPSTASEVALHNGSMTSLNTPAGQGASIMRPSTSTGDSGPRSPKPPRLSLDAPSPTLGIIKPRTDSSSTFYSANGHATAGSGSFSPSTMPRTTTNASSLSDVFSSALPLSDSPLTATPSTTTSSSDRRLDVLFLAASVYEFNIDRSRREAGFSYLTYVTGEIFDVIAERGELWLARNQDDPEKQIGWIWNKHFAKLAET